MIGFTIKTSDLEPIRVHLDKLARGIKPAVGRAVGQEANALREEIVTGLRDQAPGGRKIRPLSPMTIALRALPRRGGMRAVRVGTHDIIIKKVRSSKRKGSSKALIYHGDLLGSVEARRGSSSWEWSVGVHRNAVSRKGANLAKLAAIHEFGTRRYSITVTPKMRRFSIFLMSQGLLRAPWKVGSRLTHQVPARPFLHPGWQVWLKDAGPRFEGRVADELAKGEAVRVERAAAAAAKAAA
jgi:hypothetical protein